MHEAPFRPCSLHAAYSAAGDRRSDDSQLLGTTHHVEMLWAGVHTLGPDDLEVLFHHLSVATKLIWR